MGSLPGRVGRPLHVPSQWAIIAVLAFTGMCASFMSTMVIPIQSKLPELLNASRDDTAWVITVTLIASAVVTPIAGRLGDMYGKRRLVLVFLVLLVIGSLIAALSAGLPGILTGRAFQGTVMGVMPLGIAITRDTIHRNRLGNGVALMSATMGIGAALGMPISAFITEHTHWRLIFWIAALMGVASLGLVFWLVPASVLRTPGQFDFLGAAGLAFGLVAILLAISRGNEWGWLAVPTLGCGIGGAHGAAALGLVSASHCSAALRFACRCAPGSPADQSRHTRCGLRSVHRERSVPADSRVAR